VKFRLILATSAIAALPFALPAHGQGTPEQRAACEPDAFRLCNDAIPDSTRVEACLRVKMRQLTPGCRAVFTPIREKR
jgi:hypothetical protein